MVQVVGSHSGAVSCGLVRAVYGVMEETEQPSALHSVAQHAGDVLDLLTRFYSSTQHQREQSIYSEYFGIHSTGPAKCATVALSLLRVGASSSVLGSSSGALLLACKKRNQASTIRLFFSTAFMMCSKSVLVWHVTSPGGWCLIVVGRQTTYLVRRDLAKRRCNESPKSSVCVVASAHTHVLDLCQCKPGGGYAEA